ncbi:hypothetical protein [Pseudomonas sp. B33.4]|uniref:hypothetical protein n=1 Tax=Pseudomonas sp. B33.4 TaxID=3104265 RepID=UPI002ADEC76D|nr:hypothetical protein [Pseudomonas sp. B33.4]
MATTFEQATQRVGYAKGTGVIQKKIELPDLRIFSHVIPEKMIYCDFKIHFPGTLKGSHMTLHFSSNIKNGTHFFTEDSPIDLIRYSPSLTQGGPIYNGIKNGKGYVDIQFDLQAGTLSARIVNVDLVLEGGDEELNLNVNIEAAGLTELAGDIT